MGQGDKIWRHKRLSAERWRRRLLRKDRRHDWRRTTTGWHQSEDFPVVAPKIVALGDKPRHAELTDFLRTLRKAFQHGKRIVSIDFSDVEMFYPEGMLLFYSELSRLLAAFPKVPVRCVPAKLERSGEVLEHLGVYKMLGYNSTVTPTREDVVNWHKCSGTTTTMDEAGELIELSEQLDKMSAKKLFGGVSEAVANVVEHAYIANRGDGTLASTSKSWWMFCREMENRLLVCVCELGVGIPGSLPLKYTREFIESFVSKISNGRRPHDGRLIQSAMAIARSRTNKDHRGKGFQDMRAVVDASPGGQLHVFSNRGMFQYKDGKEKARACRDSILGTVVTWSLPLTESE